MNNRKYIAIDLKSFYASVECIERGLDPLTTNLVVADPSRSEKTICLAVTPSLKAHGVSGRARLFEVVQKVHEINARRRINAPRRIFTGSSYNSIELAASPELSLDYIAAPPQMSHYIACSTKIYDIYLKYLPPENIHVYSVDEVFMDVTDFLRHSGLSARELAMEIVLDVLTQTGITATAGIGTNLYLAKVAMDIEAKHIEPDANGVRVAELDEMSYRHSLWTHKPFTDFWRVGGGLSKKLEANGLFTMGDIARCSIGNPNNHHSETPLYKLFGINAELLIDHAWGWESCTMEDIKTYRSSSKSVGAGQVLHSPYPADKAKLIVREMTDLLVLDLVEKELLTDQMVLSVGYDIDNLKDPERLKNYKGPVTKDHYGRSVPKHVNGSINLGMPTSSTKKIMAAVSEFFDRIVDPSLLVRRVSIAANHVITEASLSAAPTFEQLDLFTDQEALQAQREMEMAEVRREKSLQKTIIALNNKYGKNCLLKAMNLEDGATTMDRNKQIGGHRA